jgi:hypothetical protein
VGNVSIPAIGVCSVAVWAAGVREEVLAGILLGFATCLKPQLGVWFVLYYLLQKRWRMVLVASVVGVLVVTVGVLWLEAHGVAWLADFLRNARGFAVENQTVDFTEADPIRFTLINLQVLLYSLLRSAAAARGGALLSGLALIATWLWLGWRRWSVKSEVLVLSTMVVISLLPTYHRNYDATLLIFPLCWAFTWQGDQLKKLARAALILMLPFAIPGGALLQQLADHGRIPTVALRSWWWNTLILPHQIWALLGLSVLLLSALARRQSVGFQKAKPFGPTPDTAPPREPGQATVPGRAAPSEVSGRKIGS